MSKLYSYIKKVFTKNYKKNFVNDYSFNLNMGANSSFDGAPLQINGSQYIKIGNNTSIGKYIWLSAFDSYLSQHFTPEITIGNNVRIGNYACITAIDNVKIGDGCLFSEYIYISDHGHGCDPSLDLSPKDQDLESKGSVIIGDNTFLGYRVCVLPGVTLGCNCVVGANSVVTKSFPDYTMIAGAPAVAIKKYSFEKKQWIEFNGK